MPDPDPDQDDQKQKGITFGDFFKWLIENYAFWIFLIIVMIIGAFGQR